MTSSADSQNPLPPVPPTNIPAVVATLDPDLAAAYNAGNSTIIQAVNAGMTTSAMIVGEIIRMGGSLAGLPPAVQTLVTERQKEMTQEADAANARLKALAAGVIGLGVMASNIPAESSMYYGGEGMTRTEKSSPYGEFGSWAEWSKAVSREMEDVSQRAASRAEISDTTWRQGMTHDERVVSAGATVTDSKQVLKRLGEERKQLDTELASDKYSPEDRQLIEKMTATGGSAEAGGLYTEQGRANARKQIEAMPDHLRDIATRMYANAASSLDQLRGLKHGIDGKEVTVTGSPDGKPSLTEADRETQRQADILRERARLNPSLACANSERLHPDFAKDKTTLDAASASDRAMQQSAGSKSVTTQQVGAEVQDVRAKVDGAVVAASAKPQADDDYGADAATPKMASAAPRLSINAQSLAAAGMLQPEGGVAANDPQKPAPEAERPRVAKPSQGMSA